MKQYEIVLEIVKKIKKNNNLINEFFELKKKYDFSLYENYTNEPEVVIFFRRI